jgi:hypothetical protein
MARTNIVDLDTAIDEFSEISARLQVEKRRCGRRLQMTGYS